MIGREKNVGQRIRDFAVYFSLGIGLASFVYSDSLYIFLICMGKEERSKFDLENFGQPPLGGVEIKLNFFNPFRLSVNIAAFSFIFVVPIFYYKIFKFRRMQDASVQGNSKLIARKHFISTNGR